MNLIQEYALLVVVAAPVAVIVAINVWLAFNGERDTLLVPTPRAYPTVPMAVVADATPAAAPETPAFESVDEPLREAA